MGPVTSRGNSNNRRQQQRPTTTGLQAQLVTWLRYPVLAAAFLGALCTVAWTQPADQPPSEEGRAVPIIGRVIWPEHDLSRTQIRVFADPQQQKLLDVFPVGGKPGGFVFALNPGSYYLMVISDQDGDGKLSPGDGIGFYGVTDLTSRPQAFVVDEGAGAMTLTLPIAFEIAADGKSLERVVVQAPVPYASTREATVSGRVVGFGDPLGARYVLLTPLAPGFPPRAAVVNPDDTFTLSAVPGTYQLLAVENINDSAAVDVGDLVAVHGYDAEMGPTVPALRLEEGAELEDITLDLTWALANDGRLRSGDGAVLGPRINPGTLPAIVTGTVTRHGQPVAGAVVRAYGDEKLSEAHYTTVTDSHGRFCLGMAPGTYYLGVVKDVDGDGATGPGDELGFWGLTPAELSARPAALEIHGAEIHSTLEIPLVMTVGPDSQPVPLAPPPEPPAAPAVPTAGP